MSSASAGGMRWPHTSRIGTVTICAATGESVPAVLTLCSGGSRGSRAAGDAARVVGGIGCAALATRATFSTGSAIAAFAARHLRVHESREERLLRRGDDRDLPAAAARSGPAPVPACTTRTTRTAGTARPSVRARDAGRPFGPAGAARAARFNDEPIRGGHGACIGEEVIGRRVFHLDAGHEQAIVERRAQDAQPHRNLRTARTRPDTPKAEGVLEAAIARGPD